MDNGFWFAGHHSGEFGLVVEKAPVQKAPGRRMTAVTIPGRNGALHLDEGTYEEYVQPYVCYFRGDGSTARQAHRIKAWLQSAGVGQRLEDSYDPEYYRLATFAGPMDMENILHRYGRCTVEFLCQPESYLLEGEIPVRFDGKWGAAELYNPTAFMGKPMIVVYHAEEAADTAGELVVNGVTVRIDRLDDQVTLDCELMDAYRQVGDGAPESWNSHIYAPVFPELAPGINTISWTGGIGAVEIIPRWWTL